MGTPPRPAAVGDPAAPLGRLRRLGPQWVAAAGNAFAGMDQSPERYAAAARLVAAWLDRLRAAAPDTEPVGEAEPDLDRDEDHDQGAQAAATVLVSAWDERESGAAAGGMNLPLTTAERDALTATAFAIRYGEVTDWLASRRRRRAMARAAGAGRGWLVLAEVGDAAGDPFVAYRRLEADPVTGSGVLVETRPDDSFTGVIHAVQVVLVDPASGEITPDNQDGCWEFDSAEAREEQVSALRADFTRQDRNPAG